MCIRDSVGDEIPIRLISADAGAAFDLSEDDYSALESARLIVCTDEAAWLNSITVSRRKIHNINDAIRDDMLAVDGSVVHQHGPQGEQSKRDGLPGVLWSPKLASAASSVLSELLVDRFPTHADSIAERERSLGSRLASLEDSVRSMEGLDISVQNAKCRYLFAGGNDSVKADASLPDGQIVIRGKDQMAKLVVTPVEESMIESLEETFQSIEAAILEL